MPAKSAKQEKFMQAVANNPKFAKKVGVPTSVGKEFTKSGGGMAESKKMMAKEVAFMKKKGAPKSMIKHEMKEAGMKKMASGGLAAGHKSADGIAHKGKTKGKEVKMAMGGLGAAVKGAGAAVKKAVAPMKMQNAARSAASQAAPMPSQLANAAKAFSQQKSGMMGAGSQMANTPQMNAQNTMQNAARAVKSGKPGMIARGAPRTMGGMGMKTGGLAAGHKAADGIAKKGKTKAMQVKMAGGGKTKKYC